MYQGVDDKLMNKDYFVWFLKYIFDKECKGLNVNHLNITVIVPLNI